MSVPVCSYYFKEWDCKLVTPLTMCRASHDDIMIQTDGCGRRGIEDWLVPDTIWGLDISPVCRIHDWMYQQAGEAARRHRDQAKLSEAEHFADGIFGANLVSLIKQKTHSKVVQWMRLRRAYKYIDAVALTDLLTVLPQPVLAAMGYETATEAMGDMLC
jgi:hypothetical protein